MPADIIGYLYAATVAAGGIMGYVKAGLLNYLCPIELVFNFILPLLCNNFCVVFSQRFIALLGCRISFWGYTWFRCSFKFAGATTSSVTIEYFVSFGRHDGC